MARIRFLSESIRFVFLCWYKYTKYYQSHIIHYVLYVSEYYGASFWHLIPVRYITYSNGWYHSFERVISFIRMVYITRMELVISPIRMSDITYSKGWYHIFKRKGDIILSNGWYHLFQRVISIIRIGDITNSKLKGDITYLNERYHPFEWLISPFRLGDITHSDSNWWYHPFVWICVITLSNRRHHQFKKRVISHIWMSDITVPNGWYHPFE